MTWNEWWKANYPDGAGYSISEATWNAAREEPRAMLKEAHRFLNAQAYTREEMEDFCKRLNDYLGIPNDS